MPLALFTADGKEQSGYQYDDLTGVRYEFPKVYRKRVIEGEPFVYHRPGGYYGRGVIGAVAPSPKADHFICQILDYQEFATPVPLKAADGHYFEAQVELGKTNVYWSQGVRTITLSAFVSILGAAQTEEWLEAAGASAIYGGVGYASPADARAVEQYSLKTALEWLQHEHVGEVVKEMPHNNPGFDVLVGPASEPVRYAEVKGTRSPQPKFWLSEGERQFSLAHSDRYVLLVIANISLSAAPQHKLHVHTGPLDARVSLDVSQWRGQLHLAP